MKEIDEDVLAKKSGFRKAAAISGVPQNTLERYVNKVKQGREITFGKVRAKEKGREQDKKHKKIQNNSYLKLSENWVGCQRCGR